jgi:hypothetical protein
MTTKLQSVLFFFFIGFSVVVAQPRHVQSVQGESWISYFLTHPLHEVEAVSKAPLFRAEIDPVSKEIKSADAQVDVTSFDSGNSNRDSHAMEVIDALDYPAVTFTSTKIVQYGDSLSVAGVLTFHGLSRNIVAAAVSKWSLNRLEVQGSFDLSLTEFKVDRPTLLLIPINDKLRFKFDAVFGWQ